MKPYDTLNVGEIKKLTDEEIKKYAIEVGEKLLDDIGTRQKVSRLIGEHEIRRQIDFLIGVHKDLTGE